MQITIADFTRKRLEISKVTPQATGAALLKQVSRQLQSLANDSIKEWQESEISKASAAGQVAGNQPNVTYQDGSSLTAKAFNKAATSAVEDNAQLTSTLGMNDLAEVYKNDPDAYQAKSDAFIDAKIGDLKGSAHTAGIAKALEGQMRLAQQSAGYKISKTYMAAEISKMKANTEMLTHTITTDAFKTAGGIFSPDPSEQGIALNGFALSKKLLDMNLHAVAPDGTPVYTAEGILSRQQAFHSNFYSTAVQSWVSEANLTVEDMVKIRKGTLNIDLGGGNTINILDEIGQEDYEKKVIKYTMTKLQDKQAQAKREKAQANKIMKADRDIADMELINNIYKGKGSSDQVIKMINDGTISRAGAASALKMLNNPNVDNNDDAYFTDLKIRQIEGEDISVEVKANASRLSSKSFEKLLTANAKANKTMQSEDEKWIVREMVKKNRFGMENPKSVRLASDVVDMYRQQIQDGIDPALAMEKARTTIDVMKDRVNRALFNSVPKYSVIKNGTIDPIETMKATKLAVDNGLITDVVYRIEMERLGALMNEKRRGTNG